MAFGGLTCQSRSLFIRRGEWGEIGEVLLRKKKEVGDLNRLETEEPWD